ncbi:MAG: integrase [Cocleimonas sp.]|jgi:integrase
MRNSEYVTKEQVISELALLDKSPKAIENIQSGFNQMLKNNYLNEADLINEFTSNFEITKSIIQKHVANTGKNSAWRSFLNDIQFAINQIVLFDISDLTLPEALYQLGKKRFGKLTKSGIATQIVKNIDDTFQHGALYRWLCGRSTPRVSESYAVIKKIDSYFNCNGDLYAKLKPLSEKKPEDYISEKRNIFVLPENLQLEIDEYILFRVKSILPKGKRSLINEIIGLDSRGKRSLQIVSRTTIEAVSAERITHSIKLFLRFIKYEYGEELLNNFKFTDVFDLVYIEEFVQYCINRDVITSGKQFLTWLISECKENTYISVYLGDSFENYSSWISRLNDITDEIKRFRLKSLREVNKERLQGNRNVKFILLEKDPYSLVNGISQALWDRSYLTTSMSADKYLDMTAALMFDVMCVCPLRIKNYAQLEILDDPITELQISRFSLEEAYIYYSVDEKCYGIYVGKNLLKNKKSEDVCSVNQLLPYLTEKINEMLDYRKSYLKSRDIISNSLNIVTRTTRSNGVILSSSGDNQKPDSLSVCFKKRTKSAIVSIGIKGEKGINPHGMRHLVATLFLRDHPQQYASLATLLMDDLKTVTKVYAERSDRGNSLEIANWGSKRFGEAA